MGHTNSTTNYSLPQFVTTDKPAWLTDINGAFSAIDSGLHTAQTDATTAKNTADNAQSDATAAGTAASTADTKAAGAIASIADAFDTTATYAVGDLVMYNSLLYVCSVAVTTPGAWTGTTNWTRTTVEEKMPTSSENLPYAEGSSTMTKSVIEGVAGYKQNETITFTTSGTALYASFVYAGSSEIRLFLPLIKAPRDCSVSLSYLETYCNGHDDNQTSKISSVTATPKANGLYIVITGSSNFTNAAVAYPGFAVLQGTITFS